MLLLLLVSIQSVSQSVLFAPHGLLLRSLVSFGRMVCLWCCRPTGGALKTGGPTSGTPFDVYRQIHTHTYNTYIVHMWTGVDDTPELPVICILYRLWALFCSCVAFGYRVRVSYITAITYVHLFACSSGIAFYCVLIGVRCETLLPTIPDAQHLLFIGRVRLP